MGGQCGSGMWDSRPVAVDTLVASSELGPHKWKRLAQESPGPGCQPPLLYVEFRDEGHCSFSQFITQPFAW